MSTTYEPQKIEKYWQDQWRNSNAFATRNVGDPYYVLEMFPYPSGDLHMGHVRNYSIGDVIARYMRMQGRDVLHPMGWDALGLPAENQAIKEKIAPQIRTPKNVARMKEQMTRLGLAYDWSREIATYTPEYYKWNQWFFIKFLEKGLVYRRESTVNWCHGCNTVLANEQVRDDGTCWRGHKDVTTKSVPEWAFRITRYAEELLADLDTLKEWPERITSQQRNWIGRSEGVRVKFPLVDRQESIEIFTTRVDTIFGCTYVVLAPEHPLVVQITSTGQKTDVQAFVEKQRRIDKIERTAEGTPKEGVFTGAFVTNPFNGERVPLWIANFVLADYGTGAVMSVPAHDQRDFEFAQRYDLPIRPVIKPADGAALQLPLQRAFTDDGICFDSEAFSNLTSADARKRLAKHAHDKEFGTATVTWHLRDWGFSRQRYWGTPIPIIYCDTHGATPVPLDQLPVRLPDFDAVELTGEGGAPLGKLPEFYETTCPICNKPAKREVETMDTFVDSAWYFARFISPNQSDAPFDANEATRWLPVNVYIGGPEHAVMHLLYFRFWTKVMRDLGLLKINEPVKQLITQGMVNALAFRCSTHGYIPTATITKLPEAERRCPTCQGPLSAAVEKMSKSKYNGIDPIDIIEKYGADISRLYTLFAAPPQKDLEWNSDGIEGLARFAQRVFRVSKQQKDYARQGSFSPRLSELADANLSVYRAAHQTLAKVSDEIGERLHFNTAIAAMMEFVNLLYEHKLHEAHLIDASVVRSTLSHLAQMLAPIAPHLAEEIWADMGNTGLVCQSSWPKADPAALVHDKLTIAVQVNGKLRGQIEVPAAASQSEVIAMARADANVARFLDGKMVKKEIFVPKRLLNFVISG